VWNSFSSLFIGLVFLGGYAYYAGINLVVKFFNERRSADPLRWANYLSCKLIFCASFEYIPFSIAHGVITCSHYFGIGCALLTKDKRLECLRFWLGAALTGLFPDRRS